MFKVLSLAIGTNSQYLNPDTCSQNNQCVDEPYVVCDADWLKCVECATDDECQHSHTKNICSKDKQCVVDNGYDCNGSTCNNPDLPDCENHHCVNIEARECNNDNECSDPLPFCEEDGWVCVECVEDDQCTNEETPICSNEFKCVEEPVNPETCDQKNLCVAEPNLICDAEWATCVECASNNDCENRDNQTKNFCSPDRQCVVDDTHNCNGDTCNNPDLPQCYKHKCVVADGPECENDKPCITEGKPYCSDQYVCVECKNDEQCESSELPFCSDDGVCVKSDGTECTSDQHCQTYHPLKPHCSADGVCVEWVDTTTNSPHKETTNSVAGIVAAIVALTFFF